MKTIRITAADRVTLAQALYHKDVTGNGGYDGRRARRRVATALGIRKGYHWAVFPVPGDKQRAFISLGAGDGKTFKRAKMIGDRRADVSGEAVDMLLSAIEKAGPELDEEALLDVEEKLHALKDGKDVDSGEGLPGVNQPSDDDRFPTDKELADLEEEAESDDE